MSDFVRVEIEAALAREIPVIPVLVDLASLPKEAQLPISLKGLAYRNAAQVRPGPDFTRDIDRLVEGVKRLLRPDLKQLEVASAPKDAGLSPGINGQHTAVDPQFTTQKAPSVILWLTQRVATLRRAPFLGISLVCVVVAPVVFLIAHLSNPWQPRIADSNQRGAQRRSPRQTPVRNSPKNRRSECASSILRIQAIPPPKRNSASDFASSILDALLLKQIDATRNSKDWRHPVEVSRGVDLEAERLMRSWQGWQRCLPLSQYMATLTIAIRARSVSLRTFASSIAQSEVRKNHPPLLRHSSSTSRNFKIPRRE